MKYVYLILFVISGCICHAQIMSIDRAVADTATPKVFSLQFSLNIDMDEQKANIFDEDGSLQLSWQKTNNTFILHAVSELITGGPSNTILNSRSIQIRDRIFPKNRIHLEPFTQYQYDGIKGLQNRYLAGMNARFIVHDRGTFRAFAATGFMYEYEDWNYKGVLYIKDVPASISDTIRSVIKSTSYIKISRFFGDKVDASLAVFYQAEPRYFFKSSRIAEFAQINFNITEHFALTLEFDSMYDTDPMVPIKKYYFSFNEGLTIKI